MPRPTNSIKTSSSDEETIEHKYPLRNKTQNGSVIELVSPKQPTKPPKHTRRSTQGEKGNPTARRNSTSINSKSNDDINQRVLRSSTSSSKSKPLVFGEDVLIEDNKLTPKLDTQAMKEDDDSVGSEDAVAYQYGMHTPPTVEYKLGSEDKAIPKSFWSLEDHREPKVYESDTSSTDTKSDDTAESLNTHEPMSSPDEADAAHDAGLIHGDDGSVSLSPHVKPVIKQVADDADSDEDSDDEIVVNEFSSTVLSKEDEGEDPAIDDEDKENRSDTKEQSYTPLSISNKEQSYTPLSISNKSVAEFFESPAKEIVGTPGHFSGVATVQFERYKQVLSELKPKLAEKLLCTQNDGELSSKAAVIKTPFLQPRLSHQGNDNFSQELDAGTQRGASTETVDYTPEPYNSKTGPFNAKGIYLFDTSSDPVKGRGRADTPFNSKAVTFADNKLGRWTTPNDEESLVDAEDDAKNKVSSSLKSKKKGEWDSDLEDTPVPYNSKTGTFTAPSLDDEDSPNHKPGVFTAPSLDESSPISGFELVESPEEGKVTNTSVMWPTDERVTATTTKSPTGLTKQFDIQPVLVLQDLLDMSYVASTPDASSCNVHHKRRVIFILRHKKVAEDIVAMILRNDGNDNELGLLVEKFDRFMLCW